MDEVTDWQFKCGQLQKELYLVRQERDTILQQLEAERQQKHSEIGSLKERLSS